LEKDQAPLKRIAHGGGGLLPKEKGEAREETACCEIKKRSQDSAKVPRERNVALLEKNPKKEKRGEKREKNLFESQKKGVKKLNGKSGQLPIPAKKKGGDLAGNMKKKINSASDVLRGRL